MQIPEPENGRPPLDTREAACYNQHKHINAKERTGAVRKNGRPGRRWFLRILLTYVSIFALVGTLVAALFVRIRGTVQDTILTGYRHQLESACESMERSIVRAANLAAMMGQDEAVRRLSMANADSLRGSVMDMRSARELMGRSHILLGDEFVASVLLFPHNAYMVSNFHVSDDYQKYYGDLFGLEGQTADAWYRNAIQAGGKTFLQPWLGKAGEYYSYYVPGDGQQVILLAVPIANEGKTGRLGVVLYYLREDWISGLLPEGDALRCEVRAEGGALLCGDQEESGDFLTLSCVSSGAPGFSLTLRVPQAEIARELDSVTQVIRLFILAGLGGILLLSLFYALRQMQSIRPLLAYRGGVQPERYASPYRYARDLLDSLSSTRDALERRVRLLESTYNENLLENLCCRGIGSSQDYKSCAALMGGMAEGYRVAVLRIGEEHRLSPRLLDAEEELEKRLSPLVMHVNPEESVYVIPEGSAEAAFGALRECLTPFGFVGVSAPCRSVQEVHGQYQQACAALEDCTEKSRLACYTGQEKRKRSDLTRLSALENLILAGREEQGNAFFGELEPEGKKLVGVDQVQLFFVLRQMLARTRLALGESAREIAVPAFLSDESAAKSLSRLHECASALAAAAGSGHIEKRRQSAGTMLAMIESDFGNPDLSADYIAEKLGCSAKHVYQTVREQTGHTVGELIESTRLQFAEELLLGTDGKNEEIAERCGFGTLNTFYRVFRRSHGVAPGEWRRQNRKG